MSPRTAAQETVAAHDGAKTRSTMWALFGCGCGSLHREREHGSTQTQHLLLGYPASAMFLRRVHRDVATHLQHAHTQTHRHTDTDTQTQTDTDRHRQTQTDTHTHTHKPSLQYIAHDNSVRVGGQAWEALLACLRGQLSASSSPREHVPKDRTRCSRVVPDPSPIRRTALLAEDLRRARRCCDADALATAAPRVWGTRRGGGVAVLTHPVGGDGAGDNDGGEGCRLFGEGSRDCASTQPEPPGCQWTIDRGWRHHSHHPLRRRCFGVGTNHHNRAHRSQKGSHRWWRLLHSKLLEESSPLAVLSQFAHSTNPSGRLRATKCAVTSGVGGSSSGALASCLRGSGEPAIESEGPYRFVNK